MGAIASNPSFQKGTLQGINISHLGEKEYHLQNAIFGGYVSSLEGTSSNDGHFPCRLMFVCWKDAGK